MIFALIILTLLVLMLLVTVLAYVKGKTDTVQQMYEAMLKGASTKTSFLLDIKDAHFDVKVNEVHYGEQ